MDPRYPEVRIELSSDNPLVWISEVRHGLWKHGVSREEIHRFSTTALRTVTLEAEAPERVRAVCCRWAWVSHLA